MKGYAEYQRGTLDKVVRARAALGTASGPRAAAQADAALTGALTTFFALAEAYPDLKASERFAQLQTDLADTENQIAYARNRSTQLERRVSSPCRDRSGRPAGTADSSRRPTAARRGSPSSRPAPTPA